jgi:uncharacterized protein (UPF0548 family)
MLLLRKPSLAVIQEFLKDQAKLDFTYAAVGATAALPPAGYTVDHTRVQLGVGEQAFATAKTVLQNWGHFQLGWVEALPRETTIQRGEVVAVMAQSIGLWWLNAARIVYVVDEFEPVRRWGFAYGTMPDHVETGEERFTIEWNRADDSVWYDILAFSRPRHVLARMGYPLVRRLQRRFALGSAATVQRAVREDSGRAS